MSAWRADDEGRAPAGERHADDGPLRPSRGSRPMRFRFGPGDVQFGRAAERDVGEVVEVRALDEAHRRESLGDNFSHEPGLELGELGAQTVTHALAEGDVPVGVRPTNIETVGVLPDVALAVGGREVQQDGRSRERVHSGAGGVTGGDAPSGDLTGVEAQHLLDGVGDQ